MYVALATLLVSVWNYIGWQRSSAEMWASSIGIYLVLGVFAYRYARTNETFEDWLSPVWGDASRGLVLSVACFAAFYGLAMLLPRTYLPVWSLRYLSSFEDQMRMRAIVNSLLPFIVLRVGLEEFVWRGHIRSLLSEELGSRIGWVVSLGLFLVVALPSAWAMSTGSPNPLRLLVVLVGGGGAAIFVRVTDRLLPGILGRIGLEWAVLAFHPLWGVG